MAKRGKSFMRRRSSAAAVVLALGCPAPAQPVQPADSGASIAVPFDAEHWDLDDGAQFVSFGGRTALVGTALVKGVEMLNGTIEADVLASESVSFAGFSFRARSFEEQEWIWFRTHLTNGLNFAAIQYAPSYHGVFCWQLEPRPMARLDLPKNQWVHMKLAILNDTATFTVAGKPVMTVDRLRLARQAGRVGLRTFRKENVWFSNFSYRIDAASPVTPPAPKVIAPNVLASWQMSASYPLAKLDALPTAYPARELAATKSWITPEVDETGLVNISRYHGTKYHGRAGTDESRPDWTILRTFIDAKTARRVKMNFGYSDAATIFLNGVPLFTGNSAFLSRNQAYSGWISYNDAVFLNLRKGRNELVAVVADDFGGWGFQAKLDDIDAIQVRADPRAK